tara:strand:+ start:3703 stop:3921 length:219 start_codon:yes stop_codon:yes gene_type:complete
MKRIFTLSLAIIFVFSSSYLLGQIGGGGPPGSGGPPCWPPPCVPIDGGISILVAIGAFFGGKSFYDFLKNKS